MERRKASRTGSSGNTWMDWYNSYNDGKGGPSKAAVQHELEEKRRKYNLEYMNKLAKKYGYKLVKQ